MQKRLIYFILPGLFAFLPATPGAPSHTFPHPEFVLSHNQFAFRLLNAVLATDTTASSKLVSPISLYLTLGMLCNGAARETRDSIALTLQASEIELPNLNSLCKETLQQLPLEDDQVQFTIANSIWYSRQRFTIVPDYEQEMENFYYAQVQPLDFRLLPGGGRINEWTSHNTMGEIGNVVDYTHQSDAMIVLNALCFKSPWKSPFGLAESYKGDFYVAGETPSKPVAYMRKVGNMSVFSDTSFTMVELPCGQGQHFSLYALLPQEQDTPVNHWVATLDPSYLNLAFDKMTRQYVDLSLPRWECKYSIGDGQAILGKLGIGTTVFEPGQADFTNMYSGGAPQAALTKIIHDSHLRVDEDGLVAATASGAELPSASAGPDQTRASSGSITPSPIF